VRKLEQRRVAGVCIEDKLFPKSNSFSGEEQPLANIEEFSNKIKAAKDTQHDADFCVVARVEAFIAGRGLAEALKRADAYYRAGADAILIHSKLSTGDQIFSFMEEWGNTCPVVIVPTKYYATPTAAFAAAGVSTVIWANHLLRSSLAAMQAVARRIKEEQSLLRVEKQIAPIEEVFRLQGEAELKAAERKYLPLPESSEHTPQISTNGNHARPDDSITAISDQPLQKTQYVARTRNLSFKKISGRNGQ
jgi:phosphoenolpyruvate phosphomutase